MREEKGGLGKSPDDRIGEVSGKIVEEGRARMQGINVCIFDPPGPLTPAEEAKIRESWVEYWRKEGLSEEEAIELSSIIPVMPPGF